MLARSRTPVLDAGPAFFSWVPLLEILKPANWDPEKTHAPYHSYNVLHLNDTGVQGVPPASPINGCEAVFV